MSALERILKSREGQPPEEPGDLRPLAELEEFEREMHDRYGLPLGTTRRLSRGRTRLSFDVWGEAFTPSGLLKRRVASPADFKGEPGGERAGTPRAVRGRDAA